MLPQRKRRLFRQDYGWWGYSLAPGGKDLEMMLRRVIYSEYAWGVSHWIDSHREFSCVCEKVHNDCLEAARAVIQGEMTNREE
jgi:hypothetical protein